MSVERVAIPQGWFRYAAALVVSALTTLAALPLHRVFEPANIVMLYLLAVVPVAIWLGRGPAVLAAIVNVLAFDWFFVPPQYTFAVADVQYVFTFMVMLIVGIVVGQLTAGLRRQAAIASSGEERARLLFEIARELSAAMTAEQVASVGERFVTTAVRGRASVLVMGEDESLLPATGVPNVDMVIARWCLQHAGEAGSETAAPLAAGKLYLPLKAPMRTRGVLVVEPMEPGELAIPEQRRLLETCAALIAIALERVHFVTVAQRAQIDMESERLRNSVLAALSHDLRTPLTALVGLSETLAQELARNPGAAGGDAKALAIRDQARRTAKLVENLLEMARLQAGRIDVQRDWQSIEELVGAALASLETTLKGRTIDVAIPADLPLVAC